MKILLTGATGDFGPYLIRELMDDHKLVLSSRSKPSEEFSNLEWRKADLTNFDDCLSAVRGVDAVQHLGAVSWPVDHPDLKDRAQRKSIPFDETFRTNMIGTYYLLQAMVREDVNLLVMAGSNCALGHGYRISNKRFPIDYLPIDENHPCNPEDTYSYTKLAGEELLASYSRAYGIQTLVTRPAGITDERERRKIADESSAASEWDPWLWCWVGSEDVARAHRLLMESAGDLPKHDFYFLNADDTTALEPSRELVQNFRPELESEANNIKNHQSFITSKKLKKAVGWDHKTSWRKYL